MNKTTEFRRSKLNYDLNDLEPVIYFKNMFYHYEIIHRNYEKKVNEMKSLKNFSSLTNENLARKVYKLDIDSDSLFFINGFINHNFFFEGLSPFRKSALEEEFINSELLHSINHKFGGLDGLKRRIISEALLMNENGWIWLVLDSRNELKVINTSGNKNPWNSNMKPLMSIDMWEHSYYIDYGANKRNYVERVFEKLLDWSRINQLYKEYNLECT